MAMTSGDFLEARKVSLSALSHDGDVEEKEKDTTGLLDSEVVDEEREYYPTNHLLEVRHVAYSVREEDERFLTKEEEEPKNIHSKLYAQAIEGKEATEREKKEALLDHRG